MKSFLLVLLPPRADLGRDLVLGLWISIKTDLILTPGGKDVRATLLSTDTQDFKITEP